MSDESTGDGSSGVHYDSSDMDSGEIDQLVAEVSNPNPRSLPVRREATMQQWVTRQRGIHSPISVDTDHENDIEDEGAEYDEEEELEDLDGYREEDTTVPQDEEKGDDEYNDVGSDGDLYSAVETEGVREGGALADAPPKAASTQSGAEVDSSKDFDDGGGFLPKYQDTQAIDSLNRELDVFGLSRVSLTKPSELVSTFLDALAELKERGRIVQTQADEIARLQGSLSHDIQIEAGLTGRIEISKHAILVAESRADAAEMELSSHRASMAEEMKHAQATLRNTATQLKQSEHRVMAKEVINNRLMDKLHDVAKREQAKTLDGDKRLKDLEIELVEKCKEVCYVIVDPLCLLYISIACNNNGLHDGSAEYTLMTTFLYVDHRLVGWKGFYASVRMNLYE